MFYDLEYFSLLQPPHRPSLSLPQSAPAALAPGVAPQAPARAQPDAEQHGRPAAGTRAHGAGTVPSERRTRRRLRQTRWRWVERDVVVEGVLGT